MKTKIQKIMTFQLCIFFLLQIAFIWNGKVLCIGDDGHVELETYCLPCCDKLEEFCEIDVSDNQHDEHSDCSNCSDYALDELLRLTSYTNNVNIVLIDISYEKTLSFRNDLSSLPNKSHSIFTNISPPGQGPPLSVFTATVLLC